MLYMQASDGHKILVLQQQQLESLKRGEGVSTPDRSFLIVSSPDTAWLAEQIQANAGHLTLELVDLLHKESMTREEAPMGAPFPIRQVVKDGKLV